VDIPLNDYIASSGKPALVSVGMAKLGEIENMLRV
jgi:sialic acid synthase SpsE